jgi:hypothetical protein
LFGLLHCLHNGLLFLRREEFFFLKKGEHS